MAAWQPSYEAKEDVMQRTGVLLLVASALLALASIAGSLVRATQPTGRELLPAAQPTDTPTPSHFVYLPLVMRDSGPVWVTIVEEGFEAPPGSLWDFWDADGETNGLYYWARRTCQPYVGDYSAWAVGGGADGSALACGSNYPDNVDSWMAYGPFSLADAVTASLSFQLRLNVDPMLNDTLYVLASSDGINYYGLFLTYQPSGWAPLTFYLDNRWPGVDMRGQPEVWIALEFVSDASVSYPGGAYVDDIVVRKCVGSFCSTAASAGAERSTVQMQRVQGVRVRPDRRLPVEPQPAR
jgi:hypothetical protein